MDHSTSLFTLISKANLYPVKRIAAPVIGVLILIVGITCLECSTDHSPNAMLYGTITNSHLDTLFLSNHYGNTNVVTDQNGQY